MSLNPQAQAIVNRLEKMTTKYGQVFDKEAVIVAMKKYYDLLGVKMPEVIVIENMEEAYNAAWDAARDAAWDAARGAASLNTLPDNPLCIKYAEIELCLLEALEKGLGFYFPMRDKLVLVPMPRITVDNQTRLHNEEGPAVLWKDKTAYFFLHGVKFGKDLYESVVNKNLSFKEAMNIEDIDQRWVAIKFLGDKILDGTKNTLLDKSERGNELWLIEDLFPNNPKAYYLRYSCPSTGRIYFSGIDPEVGKESSADSCMAWKHHLSLDAYKLLEPSNEG